MKKSTLKQIIKECLLEESYMKNQIMDIVKKHKDGPMAIQIRGSGGSSKWMNISKEEIEKIARSIKE